MQSKIQLVEKRVRESLLCNICFEDLHERTCGEDDGPRSIETLTMRDQVL
jgi:hypothetical protein